MRSLLPFPWIAALVMTSVGGWGCKPLCDNDLTCEEYERCDRITGQCVPADMERAATCGVDGDCKGGRLCVGGLCAHAPQCLYLGGAWEVWEVSRDAGPTGTVVATQDLEGCAVDIQGTAIRQVDAGHVDPLGLLEGLVVEPTPGRRNRCSGQFGGNETLSLACEPDAGGPVYHLYARPEPTVEALAPRRCRVDTECAQGERCSTNLAGVPACRLTR
jgi:hypothetical protein